MSSGLLSLDWLQFYVDCKDFAIEPGIKVERQVFSTRQYKHVDYIYIEEILTATLAWEPHSQALKQHTGLLKFSNETLYHCVLPSIVPKVCKWLGLKIISISRVDICFDFQKFKYGLMPQTLITNFITSKYFKIGQAKYKVLFGTVRRYRETPAPSAKPGLCAAIGAGDVIGAVRSPGRSCAQRG